MNVPFQDVAGQDSEFPARSDSRVGRSGFFGRASRFGAVLVGGIAATWLDAPSAFALPGCCDLAYPNGPYCGGRSGLANFSCPSGHHKQEWTCCSGTHLYICEECTTSTTTCWQGSFSCSNWYIENNGC